MKKVIVAEPAAVYQGDDESAILAAAEMLMKSSLSSLTRGYGSILLSTLFLFHILSLSLFSTSAFSNFAAVIHLSLLESIFLIYMFFLTHLAQFIHPVRCVWTVLPLSFLRVFTCCCTVGYPAKCWEENRLKSCELWCVLSTWRQHR